MKRTPCDRTPVAKAMDDVLASATMRNLVRLARATVHEARGALSAIGMHVELLGTSIDDVEDEALQDRQRRYVGTIDEERRRLQRIIEVFIAQAAVPDTTIGTFRLRDVLADVMALVRPVAAEHQVRLQVDDPEPDVLVRGRRDLVRHALLDILLDVIGDAPAKSAAQVAVKREDARVRIAIQLARAGGVPADFVARWEASVERSGGVLHASRDGAGTIEIELPEDKDAVGQHA